MADSIRKIHACALRVVLGAVLAVAIPAALGAETTRKTSATNTGGEGTGKESEQPVPENLLEASEKKHGRSEDMLGRLLANYKECGTRGKAGSPCDTPFFERLASDKMRDSIDYFRKAIRDAKAVDEYDRKLKEARAGAKDKEKDTALAEEFAAKAPIYLEKTKELKAKSKRYYVRGLERYEEGLELHGKFLAKNPGFSRAATN